MSYFQCHPSDSDRLPIVVEKADTFWKRLRGLAFSTREDRSLWIVPCSSIHTFWMQFDLHIIFLDKDGKVLKVLAHVPPRRLASCKGARSVLEIPAKLLTTDRLPREGSYISFQACPAYNPPVI